MLSAGRQSLPLLGLPGGALELAEQLMAKRAIPVKAFTDAVHIATAALHQVDLIASWNFKHIAGPWRAVKLSRPWQNWGSLYPPSRHPKKYWKAHDENHRPGHD